MSLLSQDIQALTAVGGCLEMVTSVADVADVAVTPSNPSDAAVPTVKAVHTVPAAASGGRCAPPARRSNLEPCLECDELYHKKMKLEIEVLKLKKKMMEHKLKKFMEE
ncbi:uncharacterized protein LOC124269236 isoform X2 [Haliotis rubra]|uniref:uncharacterized protein LOC124269236 isoform X2 n=1 Tax=Haliotis rubra TaxID=36100 RepID=UPI001EE5404E|nr:uncharacterized protein LOC124269236 isoform X2 [Haliotis rubra]